MSVVFADTSALYALIDADDEHHEESRRGLAALIERRAELVTHAFVIVEAAAIVQRRLGFDGAATLLSLVRPMRVEMVERELYDDAMTLWLGAARRRLSLVDCVSFAFMRARDLDEAFAFDRHFEEHGFRRI